MTEDRSMRELVGSGINEASGVGAFLRRWHGVDERISSVAEDPRRSATGNINIAVTEGSSPSMLLASGDARFEEFLEPGVAPLVRAAVAAGWITYTSCEGHLYRDGRADEMHVGIIPRNDEERIEVERSWQAAAARWEADDSEGVVELAVSRGELRCDGRIDVPTIDLYLCRVPGRSWEEYFQLRCRAAEIVARYLSEVAS